MCEGCPLRELLKLIIDVLRVQLQGDPLLEEEKKRFLSKKFEASATRGGRNNMNILLELSFVY